MAEADDRPRWARRAHAACLLELVVLAGFCMWRSATTGSLWSLWFPIVCAAAFIGLWRRVSWGQSLFSAVSVFLTLVIAATLIPDREDVLYNGGTVLEHLFGVMPPLPVCWLIVVVAATLTLAPAVALGWRKHWFRRAAW